jgi:hypothetical protein
LLADTNAMPVINIDTTKRGRINLNKGIPADLIATNSNVSPRLPKVMIDESNIANGKAKGTAVADTYIISLSMVNVSKPLPTKSSIYSQKNCITNTNNDIKKVAKNGPIKDRIINVSSFFITLSFLYITTKMQ